MLNQLEAVDKLEIICATEPNEASDDLGKLELLDDEEDKGDEVLCDVLTPKGNHDVGRKKSFSNNFKAFSGKDPGKSRQAELMGGQTFINPQGRPSLGTGGSAMAKVQHQKTMAEVRPFGAPKPNSQVKGAYRTFGKNIASLGTKAPTKPSGKDAKEENKLAPGQGAAAKFQPESTNASRLSRPETAQSLRDQDSAKLKSKRLFQVGSRYQ